MNLINKILNQKKHKGIRFSYEKVDLNFLIIKFEGKCFSGSKGNEQGEFIYKSLNDLIRELNLKDFNGIIVDFDKLEYTFGNYIFNSINLIHRLDLPKAIVFSEKSLNLKDNRPNLFFEGMNNAMEFLKNEK